MDAPGAPPPDPAPAVSAAPPSRAGRIFGHVAAALIASVGLGVSFVLVEAASRAPEPFWRWAEYVAAGLLTFVFSVLYGLYYVRVAKALAGLPGLLRHRTLVRRRRQLLVGIAAVAVVFLAAGLIQPFPANQGLEPGRLKIMSAFDESPRDPRRLLIDQWNRSHPDNVVDIVDVPGETDAQHERVVADAKQEDGSADVYLLDNVWTAEFVRQGYILPLDERRGAVDESAFVDSVIRTCKDASDPQDRLWCLPLNADAGMLFYRSPLAGFGKPTNWDDCFGDAGKAAVAAVRANPADAAATTTLTSASAAQLADEEVRTVTALEAIWAFGGQVVNAGGLPVLSPDSSEVVFDDRAKEALVALARAYQDDELTVDDRRTADEDNAVEDFGRGKALCMRNWPVSYDKLRTAAAKKAPTFEMAALPYPSALGGQNLAISRRTDNPRAAQALIEFLTDPASQLILFEVGGFPSARTDVYDIPAGPARPYVQELRTSLVGARPRPFTPCYSEFSREFRDGIGYALEHDGELDTGFPRRLAQTLRCPAAVPPA